MCSTIIRSLLPRVILSLAIIPLMITLAWSDQPKEPKTKLEAFTGTTGAVIIKGYTDVGTLSNYEAKDQIVLGGTIMGQVSVTAMSFRDAQNGKEQRGLVVEVSETMFHREASSSFVDYDEIAGLLSGIDYVRKADHSVTKLKNFEATYSTKGDLKVTVRNTLKGENIAPLKGGNIAVIGVGSIVKIYFSLPQLDKFRGLIVSAKSVLDDSQ
jgi:hypothetical protein